MAETTKPACPHVARVHFFGSYTCPETRSLWPMIAALEDAMGNDVDVRFGHLLGGDAGGGAARRASEAAEAACGQDRFGSMHAWLMDHPERHEEQDVSRWAGEAGLDVTRFQTDLLNGAKTSVHAHQIAARALGVARGPSVWVSGRRYDGPLRFAALLRTCLIAKGSDCGQIVEADDRMDGRDRWLALAAHELRSPLGALATLTELIRAAAEAGAAPNLAQVDVVHRLVQRFRRLVAQMTTAAALRGDHARPPPSEEGELGAVARQVVEALHYENPDGCQVVVDAASSVYGVWPVGWVEQVVSNLVANGRKFGRGAPVTVEISGDALSATLVVRDQGLGLAADELSRMTRPFERGANALGTPGLGLGLHVVRTLVGAMGGQLSLESTPGEGAAFRAVWPRDTAPHLAYRDELPPADP